MESLGLLCLPSQLALLQTLRKKKSAFGESCVQRDGRAFGQLCKRFTCRGKKQVYSLLATEGQQRESTHLAAASLEEPPRH